MSRESALSSDAGTESGPDAQRQQCLSAREREYSTAASAIKCILPLLSQDDSTTAAALCTYEKHCSEGRWGDASHSFRKTNRKKIEECFTRWWTENRAQRSEIEQAYHAFNYAFRFEEGDPGWEPTVVDREVADAHRKICLQSDKFKDELRKELHAVHEIGDEVDRGSLLRSPALDLGHGKPPKSLHVASLREEITERFKGEAGIKGPQLARMWASMCKAEDYRVRKSAEAWRRDEDKETATGSDIGSDCSPSSKLTFIMRSGSSTPYTNSWQSQPSSIACY